MLVNKIESLSHDAEALSLVAENIHYLMHQQDVDTATLSQRTGIAAATINSLRRGVGNPTLSTLITIADFFEVDVGDLISINLSLKGKKTSMAFEMPLIKISEVDGFLENKLTVHSTYTAEIDTAQSKRYFAITMSNDSLAPHFGMRAVFIICRDEVAEDGDIVLVKIGEHFPCLRKVFIDGDTYSFLPIAMNKDETITTHDNYQIIGIVIKSIRTFSEK